MSIFERQGNLRQQLAASQKQVTRAREWFSAQLKEPLDADDLETLRAEYEALAATAQGDQRNETN